MGNVTASIIATLGLDKSGFTQGMSEAAREAERAAGQFTKSGNISAESQDRLYTSSHRVASQMTNVTREMLSGASAGDVFAAALEGAGRSLRLSLGALAGIEIGGAILKHVVDVRAAYVKLREEVEKLNSIKPDSRFEALEQIKKQADDASAKIDELRKKLREANTPFSVQGLVQSLSPGELPKLLKQTEATRAAAQTAEVDKLHEKNVLHGEPDFVAKAAGIEEKFFEAVQRLGQRGVVELDRELENLAKDVARVRRERLQAPLEEIAKRPGLGQKDQEVPLAKWISSYDFNRAPVSPTAAYEGEQAREAQKEIDLAKQARETIGGEEGLRQAQIHMLRADEIKAAIPSLRDTDKDLTGAFRGAIEQASVFKDLIQAVRQISFANQ